VKIYTFHLSESIVLRIDEPGAICSIATTAKRQAAK
jgi:hypothetical protein